MSNKISHSDQIEVARRVLLLGGFKEKKTLGSQPEGTFMFLNDLRELFINQKDIDVVLTLLRIGGIVERKSLFKNERTLGIVYL